MRESENMHLLCPDSLCLSSVRTALELKASTTGMRRTTTWRLRGGMLLIGCLALHSVRFRELQTQRMYYQRKNKTYSDHSQLSNLPINRQPCTEASRTAADGDSMMSALCTVQAIKPVSQLVKSCRWRILSKMKGQIWKSMIKEDIPVSTFAVSYKRHPDPAVSSGLVTAQPASVTTFSLSFFCTVPLKKENHIIPGFSFHIPSEKTICYSTRYLLTNSSRF